MSVIGVSVIGAGATGVLVLLVLHVLHVICVLVVLLVSGVRLVLLVSGVRLVLHEFPQRQRAVPVADKNRIPPGGIPQAIS
ncbi:hypothetical protein [Streptomyces sp. NPDC058385]|uniref:hypothetical protein n=1 Tax=Streptomyces sp. NPDC058385 TaxID=3346473 RepID=UPI0036557876